MDSRSRRFMGRFWALIGMMVLVTGVAYGCSRAAAHAASTPAQPWGHIPRVKVICFPAPANTKAAYVIIYNGQRRPTGRFTGWRITATYRDGGTASRDVKSFPSPMRLAPFIQTGGVTWFDPHHLAGCTARVLWVH